METEQIKSSFLVPDFKIEKLEQQIARLNRRASKLGVAQIKLTVDRANPVVEQHEYKIDTDFDGVEGSTFSKKVQFFVTKYPVTVEGESPKFAGWSLAARLVFVDGATIIKSVPGLDLPEKYRTIAPVCEHCNAHRNRIDTFVVRHENGDHKAVGSSCISDFLGHVDPKILASYAEIIELAGDFGSASSEDCFGGFGGGSASLALDGVLCFVRSYARINGWVTATLARETQKTASASEVLTLILGRRLSKDEIKAKQEIVAGITDEDRKWVAQAIDWAKGLNPVTDYEHNLKAIATSGLLSHRVWGIGCSLVSAYRRHVEGEVAKAKRSLETFHVGVVGAKQTFDLLVVSARQFESAYGVKTLFRFQDADGNTLIWWSSSNADLPEGQWIRVQGTIKKHGEYKGWKQTELTRVKRIASESEQAAIDGLSAEAKALAIELRPQFLIYSGLVQRDYPIHKVAATNSTPAVLWGDEDAVSPPFSELVAAGLVVARDDGSFIAGAFESHVWDAIKAPKKKAKAA